MSRVSVETDGRTASLVLDDAERLNPLGREMLEDIIEAAGHLNTFSDLRVVVISGAGRAFTAGADVAAFAAGSVLTREDADAGRRMADAVEAIDAVTIAKIHGHCIGGGLVLAAACDLRVASVDARFSIPEVALGIPLAWGGIPRLVAEIGPAATKELVMTCRPFDAAEAKQLGFLNHVAPQDALDSAVEALVTVLVERPRGPLLATKRHVNAVVRQLAGTDRSWLDADSLVAARSDPEARAAAAGYLAKLEES